MEALLFGALTLLILLLAASRSAARDAANPPIGTVWLHQKETEEVPFKETVDPAVRDLIKSLAKTIRKDQPNV
jgi:hypothetical protein